MNYKIVYRFNNMYYYNILLLVLKNIKKKKNIYIYKIKNI